MNMKKIALVVIAGSLVLGGCARRLHNPHEVLDQTYIHPYGVPVEENNWQSQGSSGQVVSTLKSGVVVTKTFSGGILEGETSYTFPHSELIEKREIYSNNVIQKETNFHRNGTPSYQIEYTSPGTQKILTWYDNGATQCSEILENGLIAQGEYFDLTHRLDSRIDNANGFRTRRDAFGNREGVDSVVNGEMILTKTFHQNGTVKEEIPYVKGRVEGQLKTYLPDGVPVSLETWVNGQKTGTTRLFENGEIVADVPYMNGSKEGIEKRYRNGKIVVAEISWVENNLHGPYVSYVGEVTKTDYFYQGNSVSRSVYDKMTNGFDPYSSR